MAAWSLQGGKEQIVDPGHAQEAHIGWCRNWGWGQSCWVGEVQRGDGGGNSWLAKGISRQRVGYPGLVWPGIG